VKSLHCILLAALLSSVVLQAEAQNEIIFESAILGQTGRTGGHGISGSQLLGARFTLDTTVEVGAVGGHLVGFGGTIFAAIISLNDGVPCFFNNPNEICPQGEPFRDEDILATTVFAPPFPSAEAFTPLSITLAPGSYGLVFGSDLFGATGTGALAPDNPDIPGQASYFFWDGRDGVFGSRQWKNGGAINSRFVLLGSLQTQDPIIVIPGLMGSLLRRADTGARIWVDRVKIVASCCDELVLPLALEQDGVTPSFPFEFQCDQERQLVPPFQCADTLHREHAEGVLVTTDGVLDIAFADFYGDLLDDLQKRFPIVQTFPYDWRLDFRRIALELRILIATRLATQTGDTVDIIAHSQGGLIIRTYLGMFPNDHRIDTVIYLGSPHLGAPKSYAILQGISEIENWYQQKVVEHLNFNTGTFISQNFPSIHQLMPRYDFFIRENQFEPFPTTYEELPNQFLVNEADEVWGNILAVEAQLSSFAINGSGRNTLAGLKIDSGCPEPINDPRGDGTVPEFSSSAVPSTATFYVDEEHGKLPNNEIVRRNVVAILAGDPITEQPGEFQSQPFATEGSIAGHTCSPVRMQVFDTAGNLTGLNDERDLRRDIDNSDFFVFSDGEGVLLSADQPYDVELTATDNGTFTLIFDTFDASQVLVSTFTFAEVPISVNTEAFVFLDVRRESQNLNLDIDGDGTMDFTVEANQLSSAESFLEVLRNIIESFELPRGTENSLVSKLEAALRSIERGITNAASNQINAFRRQVQALRGKKLTVEQADVLLDVSERIQF